MQCALTAANAITPGTAVEIRTELIAANFDSIRRLQVDGRASSMFASMSGYFLCADGWIRTHANFPHHAEALRRALGADDRDALTAT